MLNIINLIKAGRTHILLFGTVFFVVAKIALITVPTISSSLPRLGDDSLEYMWKAVLSEHSYSHELPALADLAAESELGGKSSEGGEYWKTRIRKRSFDTHSFFYDWLNRQILATGLSLKWTSAVSEIFMVIILGAGLGLFLKTLFGSSAAALALMFLSFALFFHPGLHFLQSGQASLGLSLLLYHHLLERGRSFNFSIVIFLVVILLGFHSLSKVYVLMAMAIYAAGLPTVKDIFDKRSIFLGAVLIGLPLAVTLLPTFLPAWARYLTVASAGDIGHLVNTTEFDLNLRNSWQAIGNIPASVLAIAVLGMVGAGVCTKFKKNRLALWMALFGLALAMVSQFHIFPGYPVVVFNRLSVFLLIILFGFSSWLFVQGFTAKKMIPSVGLSLAVIFLISDNARESYNFAMHNLNSRREIVHDVKLSEQFSQFPPGTTAVYMDVDIALISSLIAGGYRHGAIVVQNYIDAPQRLFEMFRRRKPKVAVIPNFRFLNVLSTISSQDLTERRHGIPFRQSASVLVSVSGGRSIGELNLFINNPGNSIALTAETKSSGPGNTKSRPTMKVPAQFVGWLKFAGNFDGSAAATIALPQGPAWIEGVNLQTPRARLFWPWRSEALVGILLRGENQSQYKSIIFTSRRLLGRRFGFMRGLIRDKDPVLSDHSGLVFMNTVFK